MVKKQNKLEITPVVCHNCKQKKELGVDAFWCPRLVNISLDINGVYGDSVCLNCCKKMFLESIHDIHLRGSCGGRCYDCDFPIGAILDIKNTWLEKPPEKPYYIEEHIDREDTTKKFYMVDLLTRSIFDRMYSNFEWDSERRMLKIISEELVEGDGIPSLVLDTKKLPTRIIITIDRTVESLPLYWYHLRRYYWSACGHEQYFDKEKWMDKAPVIIGYGLIGSDGKVSFDKEVKYILKQIESKFGLKNKTEVPNSSRC